jgi:hypothetical protein
MENVTLMELVDEVRDLPLTVSAVLAQVISECDNADASVSSLARIMAGDQALAAMVLKLANSAAAVEPALFVPLGAEVAVALGGLVRRGTAGIGPVPDVAGSSSSWCSGEGGGLCSPWPPRSGACGRSSSPAWSPAWSAGSTRSGVHLFVARSPSSAFWRSKT